MEFRGVCVLLGVLLLVNGSLQQLQTQARRKPVRKGRWKTWHFTGSDLNVLVLFDPDSTKDAAVEDLQKQINDIVQELNLLKEQQALQTVCLKGIKTHGKCFLADPVKKSYHTASEDCNALGGVLGTPTSHEENDQLRDYIRQRLGSDQQVWLGVNDMVTEGTWVDQTSTSITYKNWDTSNSRSPQPDGGQSQNCAVLAEASGGKWLDENCREKKASLCQFNIV